MKVGILIDEILPGGIQKAAIEEVDHLRRHNHEAELLVLRNTRTKSYRYEDISRNIPIEYLSERFPILKYSLKFPGFHFFSTYHILGPFIAGLMKFGHKYDVIISHGMPASIMAWVISKCDNVQYIAFVWDPVTYLLRRVYSGTKLRYIMSMLNRIAPTIEGLMIKDATFVLAISNVHLRTLKETYRLKNEKIKIIYPGSYPTEKIPSERGDYLLSFTRWEHSKNPYFLIELVKKLPNVKLIMAGKWTDTFEHQSFLQTVKKEGVKDRIIILPSFKKSDIPVLCSKARVWVHPNFEAFGMGALEAAACGCPIIMPNGSGATEIFAHGIHGFFPSEGDIDAYAEYASQLILDERLAWKMGYEAWEVAKRYTWENHAKRLEEVLQDL
jgi:glycosyltransferase involved in cell wall biosynthesis